MCDRSIKVPHKIQGANKLLAGFYEEDMLVEEKNAQIIQPIIKHPLTCKWVMWFFKNDKNKAWSENLKTVHSFEYAEDFWAVYNYLRPVSSLHAGCDYSLFKEGIQPMWEDPKNMDGGRWMITADPNNRRELDSLWMETLLALIGGEVFENQEERICGVTVNVRFKADKLSVWTNQAENKPATLEIGRQLCRALQLQRNISIGYQVHADLQTHRNINFRFTMKGGQF